MLYNLFENRDFVSVFAVALLAEGVDRNSSHLEEVEYYDVALLAEGVDRNPRRGNPQSPKKIVALLAEGVDRNYMAKSHLFNALRRPPRGGRG